MVAVETLHHTLGHPRLYYDVLIRSLTYHVLMIGVGASKATFFYPIALFE